MPSRNYYLQPDLERMREAYVTLAVEVAVEMGANRSQAETDMTSMMELETEIANVCCLQYLSLYQQNMGQ